MSPICPSPIIPTVLPPVSYTHLDVYKRQAEMTGIIIFLIGVSSIMSWVMAFTNIPEPVSYTHLDVYKRQEQV